MASRRASSGLLLGGAFTTFTVSAGFMHSYAVFLVAFLEDFRWSRAEASLAYSTSQLVAGASSPLVGALVDRLLGAGALDVYYTPVQMKKGRPGVLITVLGPPARREALEEVLFSETTTLGVRRQEWERTALERETVAVATAYGEVHVKVGKRGGRVYNAQPEFDDCQRAAEKSGVPVKEVWAAALAAWRQRPVG
jgi:uncharacterized protein (DUF111 family)